MSTQPFLRRPRSYDVIFIMQVWAKVEIFKCYNLKMNTTFKSHSVMVDFCSYPCTLSKYVVINLAGHSKCACAQAEFLFVSYLSNHLSKFVQILYWDRSWVGLHNHFDNKVNIIWRHLNYSNMEIWLC